MNVRDLISEHRKRLRTQELRPIQIRVPDVRSAELSGEARRQALAVAIADSQCGDQDFVETISNQWDK